MFRLAPIVLGIVLTGVLIGIGSPAKAGAVQPIQLWLPWEGGSLWTYTQGPHGQDLEALDLQPPDAAGKPCEVFHSSFWVTAAADGTVTDIPNAVEIDHGGGFSSVYYHLENKQVKTGDHVKVGDRLGTPGCCPDGAGLDGCSATAPHLHFYVTFNGARLPAFGLNLGGWTVGDDGCLKRGEESVCPLEGGGTRSDAEAGIVPEGVVGGRIVSNSPRSDQDEPSTPADIAVIIDTSTSVVSDGTSRQDAARALLQATRPDDRVAVVDFNSDARVVMPLTPATTDGAVNSDLANAMDSPNEGGRTNIRLGLVTGCAELLAHGTAPAKAAVLFSDGFHNMGSFSGAEECFQQAGIPVFTYGVGPTDQFLMQEIADKTGGQFKKLADLDNPYCEFRRIRSIISGDPVGGCSTFQLQKNEALTLPFDIVGDQDTAVLEIRWRNRRTAGESTDAPSPVDSQILGPAGHVLPIPYPGIGVEQEDGAVRYTITYPLDGQWKLVVSLNDNAPDEGLFITFAASANPQVSPYVELPPSPTPEDSPTPEPTQLADTETPVDSPTPTPTARPVRTIAPTPTEVVSPTDTPPDSPTATAEATPTPTE